MYIVSVKIRKFTLMTKILEKTPVESWTFLVQSMQNAVENTHDELGKLRLPTKNCKASLKMDFVNASVEDCESALELNRVHKGPWTFPILFSAEAQLVLAFVKKNYFEGLLEKPDYSRPKYMNGLVFFNKKEKGRKSQCNLFGDAEYDEEYVDFKIVDTCCKFEGADGINNMRSAFVVYDDDGVQLTYIRACVVDYNFCKVEEINLLDMLKVSVPDAPEATPMQEVEEPTLSLKQKAIERIGAKEA